MSETSLVVGLGNPGRRYLRNRHNFGFMVLDTLESRIGAGSWSEKFSGLHCKGDLDSSKLLLLKPTTFMNLSGRSVVAAAGFYKVAVADIIVVHDDLDLPFGTIRVKVGGGTGGHKGLNSIVSELGDPGFVRVRMGIGRPPVVGEDSEMNTSDFVLGNFTQEESDSLEASIDRGVEAIAHVARQGAASAMNVFNQRAQGPADEQKDL